MNLASVVRPPELPADRRRKEADITAMAAAYGVAALTMLVLTFVALLLFNGSGSAGILLIIVLAVAYIAIGAQLCAYFVRRIAWWPDASLAQVVRAKLRFVWFWPIAAAHFLLLLIINRVIS